MIRKLLLLLFTLFTVFEIPAQETVQDVESKVFKIKQLDGKKEKSIQDIALMLDLCKEIAIAEPDAVLLYLRKIKPLIEQKKYYHGWEDYCYLIQRIYTRKGKLKEAEKIITGIYTTYSSELTLKEEVSIRFNLVTLASGQGEIERAQAIIREILPKAQTDFQKASLYYYRGENYKLLGEYKKAINDALAAIDLYKSIDDWKNVAVAYDFLGTIYRDIEDYQKAVYFAGQGLKFAKESDNHMAEMSISANLGTYHRTLKQIDSALYYYNLSFILSEKYENAQTVAQNLMNMGNIYAQELQDYTKAEKYYKQSLGICYDAGLQYGIFLNWFNLGSNYHTQKKYEKSRQSYDSVAFYAEKLKIPSAERAAQEGYYMLYKEMGDYRKALSHYEKFNDINQKINMEQSQKDIAEIHAKYDIVVRDREIERINNEIKEQKSHNVILILITFLVVLGTGSVIYLLIYRHKSLRKLYERNLELSRSSFLFEIPETTKGEEEDSVKKLFKELVDLMENEKIYKEPNLTINSMAKKLQTNRNYFSAAITSCSNMNFNNFINSYRIREAKRMILQDSTLTLNEVMYTCGFNSRTPFYMAFQKFTGMSPQQFKNMSCSKKLKEPEKEKILEG